jgi:hypothetical protein
MSTPRENFLRLMKNDNPKWVGNPWSCFCGYKETGSPVTMDAVWPALGQPAPGETGKKDAFGIVKDRPVQPNGARTGSTPNTTGDNKLIKDITCWKEFVQFPDLSKIDWTEVEKKCAAADRENYLLMAPSYMGVFEFSHYTMGFEDALMNYLVEPEDMYDLLSAYADWKIEWAKLVIDHMHPDVIHSHDDWGNKRNLFLNPETWREIIKPQYEKFYGYIKSRGVMIQHHNDSVSDMIVEDMIDLGIDMWQGPIPQNDIKGAMEKAQGRICLMGGIDAAELDFYPADEAKIRTEVRRCIDEYVPLGNFMPCVPNIIPIFPDVENIINDEMDKYGAEFAAKHFA